MGRSANVTSTDAIRQFAAAVLAFQEEARMCLTVLDSQLRHILFWLEQDRPQFWKREIENCSREMTEARVRLHQCRMRRLGDFRPEPAITSQCWLPVSQVSLKLLSPDSLTSGSFYSLISNPGTRPGTARFQNADVNNYINVSEQSMIQIVNNGGDGNDTGFTFVRGRRPWFSSINDYTIAEDSVLGSVQIRDIDAGTGFGPVRLTASCSGVILEQMTIDYQASARTALLRFRPPRNTIGESIVTVRAESGGKDGDLNTSQDNVLFERTFRVTIQQIKPRITGPEGTTLEQSPALTWTAVPGAVKYEVWINNLSTDRKSTRLNSSH